MASRRVSVVVPDIVLAMTPNVEADPRRPLWRDIAAGSAWALIGLSIFVIAYLLWQEFGWGLAQALHGDPDVAERVPRYWGFVVVAIILAVVAVATVITRRWVAFVLAVILACGSAFAAVGMWPSVQPLVSPVQQTDAPPRPCQCLSGGDCDCPGG